MERWNGKRALHLHFTPSPFQPSKALPEFSHAELNVGFHISTTAAATRTCCATFRASLVILLSQRKLHGMISGLFPSTIHYSLPAALFSFSAIHTTILCSFLLQVCSLISTLSLLEKAAGHRLSETGKTSPCARLGIWCFSPFVTLQSFKVIVIQCNGGKATEYKGITPVQNSKKKESISTVRLILMSAALLFNHAISPTYTVFQLEKQRISSSQVLL